MAQSARLALSARRFELRTFTIRVVGLDLTGVPMVMDVRLYPDTPGAPIMRLDTVTTSAAEGLKLDSVAVENGVPVSTISVRINKSTMSDQAGLGRPAEPGVALEFAYALRLGDTTRLHGAFWALPGVVDSDTASPTGDYSGSSRNAPEPADAIALTVAENEVIEIKVDGADIVASLTATATQAAESAAASASLLTPFINAPAVGEPLERVVSAPDILPSVVIGDEVVPIVLPAELTVREIARDSLDRFRIRIAGHSGGAFTALIREVGNTAYLDVSGYTGIRYIELRTVADEVFPGVPSDTIVGRVLVDFRDGAPFGTYTATIPYADGGLKTGDLQPSPSVTTAIENTVRSEPRLQGSGLFLPFRDDHDETGADATDDRFLQKFIKKIWLYGLPDRQYRIGRVKNTHPRFINIVDHETGRTVCQAYQAVDAPWDPKIKAGRGVLALNADGWRGAYAVIELEPGVAEAAGGEFVYSTLAQSGIDQRCVYTPDQVRALMQAPAFKHRLMVGSSMEFTSINAASADPRCQLAHPNELTAVHLAAETFDGFDFERPEFCGWFGAGPGETVINGPPSATAATVQSYLDGWEYGFTVHAEANQYPLHCETSSQLWGGEDQERAVFKFRKLIEVSAGANHDTNLVGGGIGGMVEVDNDTILRKRVSATNKADFSWHNTAALPSGPPNDYDPAYTRQAFASRIALRNCPQAQGVQTTGGDLNLISLIPDSDPGTAPMSHSILYGNDFASVRRTITNASEHQWQVFGAGVVVAT